MSLIKCPNCQGQVSDLAEKCLHCGNVVGSNKKEAKESCFECNQELGADEDICSHCGVNQSLNSDTNKEVDSTVKSDAIVSESTKDDSILNRGAESDSEEYDLANNEGSKGGVLNYLANIGDWFDRRMYGHKVKLFVLISVVAVLIPSILLLVSEKIFSRIDTILTVILISYLLMSFFAWLSIWRDENKVWSWKIAWPVIKESIYWAIEDAKDVLKEDTYIRLYKIGLFFTFFGIACMALGNITFSLIDWSGIALGGGFLARLLDGLGLISFLGGVVLFYIAILKDDNVIKRVKADFSIEHIKGKVKMMTGWGELTVVNAKDGQQIKRITANNDEDVMNKVMKTIQRWEPRRSLKLEKPLQKNLYRTLRKAHPDFLIEEEMPLPMGQRADLVINKSLMIEMKKDFSIKGERQRAETQLSDYIEVWGNKGPIILLVCRENYDKWNGKLDQIIKKKRKEKKDIIAVIGTEKTAY